MKLWRSRYRLLLVEPLLVVLFGIAYAALAAVVPLCAWCVGLSGRELDVFAAKFTSPAGRFVLVGAAVYALFRATAFHPFWHEGYRQWLATTPWAPGTPLPLQPVHLVWQDALAVAALTLLSLWHPGLSPSEPLTVFGFTYLLTTALALLDRRPRPAVVLLAGLPLVLLPAMAGSPAAGVLAVLYAVASIGTRDGLSAMSSEPDEEERQRRSRGAAARVVGWPFKQLGPTEPPAVIGVTACLLGSTLTGWWVYAVASRLLEPGLPPALFLPQIGLMVAVPIAVIRVWRYVAGYLPAVGIIGRLASGRLIVPGYDKVFVAPALVLFAGIELPRLLSLTPLDLAASSAILVAACLALGFGLGPTRQDWQLTGAHRLCRAAAAQPQQQRLQQS